MITLKDNRQVTRPTQQTLIDWQQQIYHFYHTIILHQTISMLGSNRQTDRLKKQTKDR